MVRTAEPSRSSRQDRTGEQRPCSWRDGAVHGLSRSRRSQQLLSAGDAQKGPLWRAFSHELAGLTTGPQPGDRIGPYRLVQELDRGGIAVVYLALRAGGGRCEPVAVKLLDPAADLPELRRRLQQEQRILAMLDHPAITRLLDGGVTSDGRPYLVLEHVAGLPIDRYCARHQLPVDCRLQLFLQVLTAVQHAHRHLVVHRDLKPAHVLVRHDGQVKLLDFGIATFRSDCLTTASATRSGLRAMTLEYASPEQVSGAPVTASSDIYQLGLLLYELLTGQRPFQLQGCTVTEARRIICEQQPTPPSRIMPEPGSGWSPATRITGKVRRDRDLDTIVLTALNKRPEHRYGTVHRLSTDITRLRAGQPIIGRRPNGNHHRLRRPGPTTLLCLLLLTSLLTLPTACQRPGSSRS